MPMDVDWEGVETIIDEIRDSLRCFNCGKQKLQVDESKQWQGQRKGKRQGAHECKQGLREEGGKQDERCQGWAEAMPRVETP